MDVKTLLSERGIVPNKALGQNFLINENAVSAIISAACTDGECVLEIGAGAGALTHEINRRAKKTLVIEIDRAMTDILSEAQWSNPETLKIVTADFLKTDDNLLRDEFPEGFCVVANLPYYVTTPIAMKLLKSGLPIRSMTLMMQREAAEHFTARMGTKLYSPLCLLTEYLFTVEKVADLSPADYYPQPDVYSCVLHFTSREADTSRLANLSRVLTCSFAMRRKTILNNLCSLGLSKDAVRDILNTCGIAESSRAEQLSLSDFLNIESALRG